MICGELRSESWILLALLVALPGCRCGGKPATPPRLDQVLPASGLNTDETIILLTGEAFTPRAGLRFGSTAGDISANPDFGVFVGDAELTDVAWLDSKNLRARVPAGMPVGKQTVRVADPYGRETSLADGFEVRKRQGAVLAAEISTPVLAVRVGSAIAVQLQVTNTGDTAVEGLLVVPGPPTGKAQVSLVGVTAGPPVLAPGASQRYQLTYVTMTIGAVVLTASARGVDAFSREVVAVGPLSTASIGVISPPVLGTTVVADRSIYSVGQPIALLLEVTNQGDAPVLQLLPEASALPTGLVDQKSAPLARGLLPLATQSFPFSFDTRASGVVTFHLSGQGTDSQTSAPVAINPASTSVTVVEPAKLAIALTGSSARLVVGQRLTLTAQATNFGTARAQAVTPSVAISGPGAVTQVSAPAPSAVGATPVSFQWQYDAVGPGAVSFTVGAVGLDENSGSAIAAAPSSFALAIDGPGALTAILVASPAVVNMGSPISLMLTVTNPGQTAALAVMPAMPALSGAGGASLVSGPAPGSVTQLAPLAAQAFTWTYTASALGPLAFSSSASGTDVAMAAIASALATANVLVQRPAALTTGFSTPMRVNVGQGFGWSLTVTNGGDSAANSVSPGPISLVGTSTGTSTGGPIPSTQTIAGGASASFAYGHLAGDAGTLSFRASPAGVDALDSSPVVSASATSSSIIVERPAKLTGTLALPANVSPSTQFTATMQVQNRGEATAVGVTPSALGVVGNASLVSGPVPMNAVLLADGGVTFSWVYAAGAAGTINLAGSATGTDINDGNPLTTGPLASNSGQIGPLAVCYVASGCDAGVCGVTPSPPRTFCDGGQCDGAGRCAPFCDASKATLVACYQLEGVLTDGSQYGNNGTRVDGAFDAGTRGLGYHPGAAAITVRDHPSLDCTTALTLEAWVRLDAFPAAGARYGIIDNDGQYGLFVGPGGDLRCATAVATNASAVIGLGAWHHVACIMDGAGARGFVDGVQVATTPASNPNLNTGNTNGLHLGENSPNGDVLIGTIDGLRIWCEARAPADLCTTPGECG